MFNFVVHLGEALTNTNKLINKCRKGSRLALNKHWMRFIQSVDRQLFFMVRASDVPACVYCQTAVCIC
jgi:hypothetical protein